MTQYQTMTVCENDQQFCDGVHRAGQRLNQRKISVREFWGIRQKLQREAVKRHQRYEMNNLLAIAMQSQRVVYTPEMRVA